MIVYEQANRDKNDWLMEQAVKVENGEAKMRWRVTINNIRLNELGEHDKLQFMCAAEPGKWGKKKEIEIKVVFCFVFSISTPDGNNEDKGKYILESTNSSYKQTKTIKDDMIPGDNIIQIKFTELIPGCDYAMYYLSDKNGKIVIFDVIPFFTLLNL